MVPPLDFGVTRRSVPSFAPTSANASVGRRSFSEGGKATEGYPPRIQPGVYTRGFLRRRVKPDGSVTNVIYPVNHKNRLTKGINGSYKGQSCTPAEERVQ